MSESKPVPGCLGVILRLFGVNLNLDQIMPSLSLEAELYPPNTKDQKFAELDFVKFKSGDISFKAEIESRSGIPVGEEAVVLIHGVEVCRVTMGTGYDTEHKMITHFGDEAPPIELGDLAELMYQGEVIASGEFVARNLELD